MGFLRVLLIILLIILACLLAWCLFNFDRTAGSYEPTYGGRRISGGAELTDAIHSPENVYNYGDGLKFPIMIPKDAAERAMVKYMGKDGKWAEAKTDTGKDVGTSTWFEPIVPTANLPNPVKYYFKIQEKGGSKEFTFVGSDGSIGSFTRQDETLVKTKPFELRWNEEHANEIMHDPNYALWLKSRGDKEDKTATMIDRDVSRVVYTYIYLKIKDPSSKTWITYYDISDNWKSEELKNEEKIHGNTWRVIRLHSDNLKSENYTKYYFKIETMGKTEYLYEGSRLTDNYTTAQQNSYKIYHGPKKSHYEFHAQALHDPRFTIGKFKLLLQEKNRITFTTKNIKTMTLGPYTKSDVILHTKTPDTDWEIGKMTDSTYEGYEISTFEDNYNPGDNIEYYFEIMFIPSTPAYFGGDPPQTIYVFSDNGRSATTEKEDVAKNNPFKYTMKPTPVIPERPLEDWQCNNIPEWSVGGYKTQIIKTVPGVSWVTESQRSILNYLYNWKMAAYSAEDKQKIKDITDIIKNEKLPTYDKFKELGNYIEKLIRNPKLLPKWPPGSPIFTDPITVKQLKAIRGSMCGIVLLHIYQVGRYALKEEIKIGVKRHELVSRIEELHKNITKLDILPVLDTILRSDPNLLATNLRGEQLDMAAEYKQAKKVHQLLTRLDTRMLRQFALKADIGQMLNNIAFTLSLLWRVPFLYIIHHAKNYKPFWIKKVKSRYAEISYEEFYKSSKERGLFAMFGGELDPILSSAEKEQLIQLLSRLLNSNETESMQILMELIHLKQDLKMNLSEFIEDESGLHADEIKSKVKVILKIIDEHDIKFLEDTIKTLPKPESVDKSREIINRIINSIYQNGANKPTHELESKRPSAISRLSGIKDRVITDSKLNQFKTQIESALPEHKQKYQTIYTEVAKHQINLSNNIIIENNKINRYYPPEWHIEPGLKKFIRDNPTHKKDNLMFAYALHNTDKLKKFYLLKFNEFHKNIDKEIDEIDHQLSLMSEQYRIIDGMTAALEVEREEYEEFPIERREKLYQMIDTRSRTNPQEVVDIMFKNERKEEESTSAEKTRIINKILDRMKIPGTPSDADAGNAKLLLKRYLKYWDKIRKIRHLLRRDQLGKF